MHLFLIRGLVAALDGCEHGSAPAPVARRALQLAFCLESVVQERCGDNGCSGRSPPCNLRRVLGREPFGVRSPTRIPRPRPFRRLTKR